MLQLLSRFKIDLRRIEPAILILILLFYSGVWYQHVQPAAYESKLFTLPPEDPIKKLVTIATYGIIAFLVMRRWKQLVALLTKDILFTALIGVSIASVFWSASPDVTADNAKALIRSTVLGAYVAMRYDLKDILCLIRRVAMIAMILSVALYIVDPAEAIHQGLLDIPGGWRGAFFHKNELAEVMAMGAFAFLIPLLNSRKLNYQLWFGLVLTLGFLAISNGKTPLVAFGGVLCCLPCLRVLFNKPYKLQAILGVGLLFLTVGVGVWVYSNLGDILIAIGKDPTFNGRTDVWPMVLERIVRHPILGYGYQGYWAAFSGEFKADFRIRNPMAAWTPGHAHSGFLELLLSLGIVGFLMFTLSFIKALSRAIHQFRSGVQPESIWYIQIFLFTVIVNATGGLIPAAAGLVWVLYVVAIYSLALDYG